MSDRELRQILQDVIEDIDSGRVRPPRRLMRWLGPSALAVSLGVAGAAGCDARPVGVESDGGVAVTVDAGLEQDAEPPRADAQVTPDAQPQLDAGPLVMYGPAWPPVDGGAMEDYGVSPVEPDGGPFDLYGVPPDPGE